MKGRPVSELIYDVIFPKPKASDPQSFHVFLNRNLILEVRQEVHSFYGHLDTQEAKYPGLDYTHPTHRIRLSRWPWHRRLFRAFDALRLTHAEIDGLTKWEGTKWAKERFEKEQGITIRDTTSDDFGEWIEPEDRPEARSQRAESLETEEPDDTLGETIAEEESDEELESVGVALNERLRERVALRNVSGDLSMPLDEEWENWLKNAIESGELPQIARFSGPQSSLTADDIFPSRMLAAARAGHWNEIPDFLHDMIRQSLLEMDPRRRASTIHHQRTHHHHHHQPPLAPSPGSSTMSMSNLGRPTPGSSTASMSGLARSAIISADQRRTYSDLRLPPTGDNPPPRLPRTARPGA